MKIYDISQEVFSCSIFPGDDAPVMDAQCRMERGDTYNLTAFTMCAHNGTHIDAPFHFFADGATVEAVPLEKTVGLAYVTEQTGTLSSRDAENIIDSAKKASPEAAKRLLIKGDAVVSAEAAEVFAAGDVLLVGGESQSVGPVDAPMAVHKILLGAGTVLLEGIRLSGVGEGVYFLSAAPLSLGGADGAPCRAILIDLES
ncbi:MAG: cyclase [Ruminococcaceae bacterium]|nr:cyclase [Oscillospiraceae bacterium]